MAQFSSPGALLVACVPVFCLIYLLAYLCLFAGWKHKQKARLEAASCCMSMVHGALTSGLAGYELLRQGRPWRLAAPNTPLQDAAMEVSIAYFLVDLLHYLLFVPEDYKFIVHHAATSLYMASCRFYVTRGGMSVMALLGLGEATTPLQSLWTISRMGRDHSPLAKRIYNSTSLPFTLLFTLTRGVLGPLVALHLCRFYLSGHAAPAIPFWLSACWMALLLLGLLGSLLWLRGLWAGLRKFRARQHVDGAKSHSH